MYRRWWHFVVDYMTCKLSNSNGLVGALSFLDCLGCNYKRTLLRNNDEIPRNSKRKSKMKPFEVGEILNIGDDLNAIP